MTAAILPQCNGIAAEATQIRGRSPKNIQPISESHENSDQSAGGIGRKGVALVSKLSV